MIRDTHSGVCYEWNKSDFRKDSVTYMRYRLTFIFDSIKQIHFNLFHIFTWHISDMCTTITLIAIITAICVTVSVLYIFLFAYTSRSHTHDDSRKTVYKCGSVVIKETIMGFFKQFATDIMCFCYDDCFAEIVPPHTMWRYVYMNCF